MTLFTPEPGDRVQVGNDLTPWTVGEIREKPYKHANVYRREFGAIQTKTGVPLAELHVVVPYEARPEPKERPAEALAEKEVAA